LIFKAFDYFYKVKNNQKIIRAAKKCQQFMLSSENMGRCRPGNPQGSGDILQRGRIPIFPVRRTKKNQGSRAIYVKTFIWLGHGGRPSLKIYNAKLVLIA